MFKQRFLTSLVLVPLVLLAIYYAPSWLLGAVVLMITLISGWEWIQLIPLNHFISKILFIGLLLAAVWFSAQIFNYWLVGNLILWGLILPAVLTFPASQVLWGDRVVVSLFCLILVPAFVNAMIHVYQLPAVGSDLIVYLLFLVWAADIGAYLMGKRWGKNKLIPKVSPGKTLEGALGGFLLAMAVAVLGYYWFTPTLAVNWFVIAICTILISMLGDLFISVLKRRCKLKDTGHILPGHGGVLDRLDSLIAAFPLFYYGIHFFNPGL